jgi:hypothetical protein
MTEGKDVVTVINEVRAKNQQAALPDPYHIAGFGPGEAPPPPFPEAPEFDDFDDSREALSVEEAETPTEPESPLVALGRKTSKILAAPPPVPEKEGPTIPEARVAVMDSVALYEGQGAVLTEKEQALVARIIVGALHRQALDRVRAVREMLPKRKRSKKAKPDLRAERIAEDGVVYEVAPPEKKKRGRPRKPQP